MTTMDQEDVTREKKMPSSGGRSAPVLPWMRDAIAVQEDALCSVTQLRGLDPRLRAHLMEQQIGDIFSIQLAVWEMCCGGKSSLHDICFSAPTGSGKTLAYGLPIVNALAEQNHSRHRLNCIMVLPTRGLAVQVHSVIAPLCESVGLECRLACGCQNIRSEAMELMSFDSYDIAIFTPGRLVAHIECTKGFSTACSGVRYFVADEADRLLRQTYNDWITKLFRAFYAGNNSDFDEKRPQISRKPLKFVVSATLTRDPSKLESLELSSPRFITFVQEENKYKLPSTLQESKLVVADELKPAVLCTLLAGMKQASCVVFVSSVESTETLGHLLSIIEIDTKAIGKISQYSAAASIQERESALDEFRSGRSKVLVCSDAITRGIDIEGVEAVINYDAPVYPKTYVHRAGRTARAGKAGKVITLLRREDVRHFKAMLRKADNNYVKDEKMDSEQIQKAKGWVEDGLKALRKRLQFSKEEQHKDASSKVTENPKSKRNNTMKKKVKGFPEFII